MVTESWKLFADLSHDRIRHSRNSFTDLVDGVLEGKLEIFYERIDQVVEGMDRRKPRQTTTLEFSNGKQHFLVGDSLGFIVIFFFQRCLEDVVKVR